jgi:multidrug efflux pump subunit AcrA (membrane-fusion protein)
VETVQIESRETTGYVEITGTVIGKSSVPLTSKLMSEITLLSVEEGQSVTAGQVLVVLDDSDIVAMRSEAAAYRAEAAAALLEVDAVRQQAKAVVSQAEAGLAQARASLADAERDQQRMQQLYDKNVASQAELDKAELAQDIAREAVSQAEAAIEQAQAAIAQAAARTPQVEAKQQQARARDLQAAALQEYAVLRAPFDGVVSAKYFQQGQLSVPGQPILLIEQSASPRVQLELPDHLVGSLNIGDTLDLTIDAADGPQLQTATLVVLGTSADPASRTILARLELAEGSGLRSGQFVRVRVPGSQRSSLAVPSSAVVRDGELSFVWRVSSGGLLTRAAVDLGDTEAELTEIARGLSAGDRIVVNPGPELHAGARVAVPATAGKE